MRALFTTKKTSAAAKHAPKTSANGLQGGGDALDSILSIPMPNILLDSEYIMDVFTAASINSDSLQRYVNNTPEKSSAEITALINVVNKHKWTPLMYAAYLGHRETSQLLLSRGANPAAHNESGQTALMMASSCGSADIVDILLRFSARINEQDKYGRAPLHYAVKYNQAKISEVLLSHGADPNLPDIEDMTPTLMACEVGNENTVTALLRHNGDANRWNKHSENGARLAFDHPKILSILQRHKSNATNPAESPCNPPKPSASTEDSATNEVIKLLQRLGLEKYERNFTEHNVSRIEDFGALNEEVLTKMGITLFGPKKKILDAVLHYRQNGAVIISSRDNSPAVEKVPENDSGTTELAQIGAELLECQRELQQLSQSCVQQTHALHDCQHIQAQAYMLLTQVAKTHQSLEPNTVSDIKSMLSALGQMDIKLTKLLGDTK